MSQRGFDIAIIGGGVIGASIAHHLAREGAGRIVLLERHYVCAGTTGQSGAIVRQHYSNDFTSALARDSLQTFRNWSETIGGECGFEQTGVLVIAGETAADGVRANVAMHQTLGIECRLVSPADVAELDDRIDTTAMVVGAWESTAGRADPVATVHAFIASARRQGVDVREGVMVTGILTNAGRVRGIETTSGPIPAGVVINAGNLWGERLLRPLGVELPLHASRHPMTMLRRSTDFGPSHPVVLDLDRETYVIPRGAHTLSGWLNTHPGDLDVDPDNYQRGITEIEIARFLASGSRLLRGLDRFVVQGGWAGIYDDTPDSHPVLDELSGYEGLFVAIGFSGHGFKLSPEFGRLMARRIVGGPTAAPALRPFRFARFAGGDLIGASYASSVIG